MITHNGATPLDHPVGARLHHLGVIRTGPSGRRVRVMQPYLRYTLLAFHLNAMLDRGKTLDVDEVHRHVEVGDVLDWVSEQFADDYFDISGYTPADRDVVVELFQGLANAVDSRRSFGVEHNGICLLLAYCIEGIQQLNP